MSKSNPRGKGWACLDCNHRNEPIVCKLTSFPPLTCGGKGCKTRSSTSYEWRMTQAIMIARKSRQEIHIDVPIYKQDSSNCALYASLVVVQIMWMLHYAWNNENYHSVDPDALALAQKYRDENHANFPRDPLGRKREVMYMDNVVRLLSTFGIPLKYSLHSLRADPGRTLTIKSGEKAPLPLNIEYLTRLIGNGFPLTGTVPMGRIYDLVSCEQVYYAPELIPGKVDDGDVTDDGLQTVVFHTVALIGSGLKPKAVAGSDPCHETYFIARNSRGYRSHPSTSKGKSDRGQGIGGDFLVWASDLCEVWAFEIVDDYLPPN